MASPNLTIDQIEAELHAKRAEVRLLERLRNQLVQGNDFRPERGVEAIRQALVEADRDPLTVSQIANRMGMATGSVRVYLYKNRDLFEPEYLSARRVRWRLREEVLAAT